MDGVIVAYLFNNGKHPRLPIVISVDSPAEVDLFWVWIGIVRGPELEHAVHQDDGSSL